MEELKARTQQLEASTAALTAAADTLAVVIERSAEREHRAGRRFWLTMGSVFAVLASVAVMFAVILGVEQAAKDSRHAITDCTTPAGTCYQQNQRQTARLVGKLDDVAIMATVCEDEYRDRPFTSRTRLVRACVARATR